MESSVPGTVPSYSVQNGGWSGGAIVLGKHPVPGRPTIWITVGQGPTVLAVGAGGGCMDIFTLIKQLTNQYKMCPAKAAYLFKPLRYTTKCTVTQKEITSQTDEYLVILSSKTYVFEDKMDYVLVNLTSYFFQCNKKLHTTGPVHDYCIF